MCHVDETVTVSESVEVTCRMVVTCGGGGGLFTLLPVEEQRE